MEVGNPLSGSEIKWNAFGESQQDKTDDDRNMQLTDIGFAFVSPMLLLQEGERIIKLDIILSDADGDFSKTDITNSIIISISGEKEWITPKSFSAIFTRNSLTPSVVMLSVTCKFTSSDGSIVPFNESLPGYIFDTIWPVLKIILKPEAGIYNDLYNLQIISSNISVTVNGVKNFTAQNDQSSLDIAKPFLPFGSSPVLNSSFYLGNAEVFQKKLTNFSLDILWNSVPQPDLIEYYNAYLNGNPFTNLIFTVRISLLYEDKWLQFLHSGDYFLFDGIDATRSNHIEISPSEFSDCS